VAFDYFTIATLATEMEAAVGSEIAAVEHHSLAPESASDADGGQPALFIALRPSKLETITGGITNRFGTPVETLHMDSSARPHAHKSLSEPSSTLVHDGARYLRGSTIVAVAADRRERSINLRLRRCGPDGNESFGRLVFELVHGRFQTLLMAERSERVIGLWSRPHKDSRLGRVGGQRIRVGQPYAAPPNTRLLPGEDDWSAFLTRLGIEDRLEPPLRVLTRLLCGADRHVSAELLERSGMGRRRRIGDYNEPELQRIWRAACSLFEATTTSGSFTWTEAGTAHFSSLQPARPVEDLLRHATVSEAVIHWCHNREADLGAVVPDRHQAVRRSLRTRLRALERKRSAIQADLDEVAEAGECAKKGAVLLAHATTLVPGAQQVELLDSFDIHGDARILIELDPQRSIADMAGRYLKRATKLKKRAQLLPVRLARLDEEIDQLKRMAGDGEQGSASREQIDHWIQETSPRVDHNKQAGKEAQARPRRYRTSAGWIVWAGRNNRENDVLTHRLAAPEDIWFHAHGYAGSHVVLRRDGRKEQPSARTLEEAAGVAAYWSKGKTASKVSVAYTAAKHVRKPRGAAPGLAVLSKEKTILVRPQLIPEEDETAAEP